jgi:hypothetical protein
MDEASGAFTAGKEHGLGVFSRPNRLGFNVFNCTRELISKG